MERSSSKAMPPPIKVESRVLTREMQTFRNETALAYFTLTIRLSVRTLL